MAEDLPTTLPAEVVAPLNSLPHAPRPEGHPEPLFFDADEIPVPGSVPGSIRASAVSSRPLSCATPRTGSQSLAAIHTDEECNGSMFVQVGSTTGRSSKIWQQPRTPQDDLLRNTSKHSNLSECISTKRSNGSIRRSQRTSSKMRILEASSTQMMMIALEQNKESKWHRFKVLMRLITGRIQKYSLPLVLGVISALVWNNIDEHSYFSFVDGAIIEDARLFGADLHGLSLHFVVNDIFMCFFFGLAIKEVAEALLPGGSLHPLRKAINPLLATLGGVVGPIACYALLVSLLFAAGTFDGQMCVSVAAAPDDHRRLAGGGSETPLGPPAPCTMSDLLKGWGVPTATDISLAWMFALQVFGQGHPAINFLLLLAIVDDALGVLIIAIFYSDPSNPVEPAWLGLVAAAVVLSFGMRKLWVPYWSVYVLTCGFVSWLGLLKSHVHPALALTVVVPFMPASHALEADEGECDLGACDLGPKSTEPSVPKKSLTHMQTIVRFMAGLEEEAPLHQFEHHMKLPVDLGMFFFGLANAGVRLGSMGGITASVGISLLLGKMVGIAGFSLLGVKMGFGLPDGLSVGSLFAMSAIAGVGLTVALFVANEAFVDQELRSQAKMGAVLSVACGGIGWATQRLSSRRDESA